MYCPKCGNELPEGSKFCGFCGNQIKRNAQGTESKQKKIARPAGESMTQKKKKSGPRKSGRAIVIAAAVCVLFVAVIAVWALSESWLDSETASEETVQEASDGEETESSEASDDSAAALSEEYDPYDISGLSLEIWDGTLAESYAGGDGSSSNPYQISNGAELALFAHDVSIGKNDSAYFVLTSDILMNDIDGWEDWLDSPPDNVYTGTGMSYHDEFSGTFDGQGHTIYGLYTSNGLIGVLYDGGVVKNVTLTACVIDAGSDDNAGGIVGEVTEKANVQITGCIFNGIVRGRNAGGIVGYVTLTEDGCTIEDCKVRGEVISESSGYNAGGIVGWVKTDDVDAYLIMRYCTSHADVTGFNAGGIVGALYASSGYYSSGAYCRITYCASTGDVMAQEDGYAGGIVGDLYAKKASVSLRSCFSSGDIDDDDEYRNGEGNIGGIAGMCYVFNGSLDIYYCYYARSGVTSHHVMGGSDEDGIYVDYTEQADEDELESMGYIPGDEAEIAVTSGSSGRVGEMIVYEDSFGLVYAANENGSGEILVAHKGGTAYVYDYYDLYSGSWVDYVLCENTIVYTIYDDSDGLVKIISLDPETRTETVIESCSDYLIYLLGEEDGQVYLVNSDSKTVRADPETGVMTVLIDDAAVNMGDDYLLVYAYEYEKYNFYFYDFEGTQLSTYSADEYGTQGLLNGEFLVMENEAIYVYDPNTASMNLICSYDGPGDLYDADDDYIYTYEYIGDTEEDGNYYNTQIYRIDRVNGEYEEYEKIFMS